jgi:hypothetical protein
MKSAGKENVTVGILLWRNTSIKKNGSEYMLIGDPEYYVIAETYESKDGEYRPVFMHWSATKTMGLDDRVNKIIETTAHSILIDGDFEYKVIYLSKVLRCNHIDMIIMRSMSLFVSYCTAVVNISGLSIHVPALYKIISEHISTLVINNAKAANITDNNEIVRALGYIYIHPAIYVNNEEVTVGNSVTFARGMQCGVKFTPLTTMEVMSPMDIIAPRWRELLANEVVTDLVANNICFGFPTLIQFTALSGVGEEFFESHPMKEKFKRSKLVQDAIYKLRDARKSVQETQKELEDEYEVEEFDSNIYEAIAYAQRIIEQSGVTILQVMEHVGFTIGSAPGYYRARFKKMPDNLLPFGTTELSYSHIFEALYTLHGLHTVAGIIHSDLHINNLTIWKAKISDKEGYVKVFMLGDSEDETYVFRTLYNIGVIDFSRCIISSHGEAAKRLISIHGDHYMSVAHRLQSKQVLRVLGRWFPSVVTPKQEAFKGFAMSHPDITARLMSYVDYLSIAKVFGETLFDTQAKEPANRKFYIHPDTKTKTKEIEAMCIRVISDALNKIQKGETDESLEWAGNHILPALFADHKYDPLKHIKANMVFNCNNPMQYSFKSVDLFPIESRIPLNKDTLDNKICKLCYYGDDWDTMNYNSDLIHEEANKAKVELDVKDGYKVTTHSSWL